LPITGDAWDFLSKLKETLLKEVEHHDALKITMTEFWDLFADGSTTYSTQCHECETFSIEEQPFAELILYFDEMYHQQGTTACTLRDLMKNSSSTGDTIDDYNCRVCNKKTKATRTSSVDKYPKVLCIALSRASNRVPLVTTSVDFPIVNFKPKDYSNVQENTDDVAYDLLATVCHLRKTNGGHYFAICKQHHSGVWFNYDDDLVEKSDFTKLRKGVRQAKVDYQRQATLLFYIRQQSAQVDAGLAAGDDGNDDVGTNSTPKSRTSKFSALANDNITTQLNARSISSTNDDQSISDSDNNYSDDDDKQNSAFASGPGACSWGRITKVFGNSYSERCYCFNQPVIRCAHNGCMAVVHKMCQLDWSQRMNNDFVRIGLSKRFDDNISGPFFCPEHNIQRTEYINSRKRST
jgi:hypothetical protein